MSCTIKMTRFILVITFIHATIAHEWVDPHDMNTNAKAKFKTTALKKSSIANDVKNDSTDDASINVCSSYLKRLVGVLVNTAHLTQKGPKTYQGHIRFTMKAEDFDFLNRFSEEKITLDTMRKLNRVITEAFHRNSLEELLDIIETFQIKLYNLVVNVRNLWILGICCSFFVIYRLFQRDFALNYILKYLIVGALIADYAFRYRHLMEEAELHNLNVVYSAECDRASMSWITWYFRPNDCLKKGVTPLDVFLYQVKSLIIVPLQALGTGLGGFGSNMFSNLPWGLNLVMWPIMLFFSLICLLLVLTICTGQSIDFNMFHLIKLRFGGQSKIPVTNSKMESIMEQMLHKPKEKQLCYKTPVTQSVKQISKRRKGISNDTQSERISTPEGGVILQESIREVRNVSEKEENITRVEPVNLENTEPHEENGGGDGLNTKKQYLDATPTCESTKSLTEDSEHL